MAPLQPTTGWSLSPADPNTNALTARTRPPAGSGAAAFDLRFAPSSPPRLEAGLLPQATCQETYALHRPVAIVGRPNVGKSSLLNAIVGEPRSVVSAVSGTTRDAVDTRHELPDKRPVRPRDSWSRSAQTQISV